MTGGYAERIEAGVDAGAAALLGAATAVMLYWAGAVETYVATGAAITFAFCFHGLRSLEIPSERMALPGFKPAELECEIPELVLTEADRFEPEEDALLLDDVLAGLGPDARVVRLFDLKARVDRHCKSGSSEAAPPDASQALYDALANLRRSLR